MRWDAARLASERPLPKPRKMHGPEGADMLSDTMACRQCGYHVCALIPGKCVPGASSGVASKPPPPSDDSDYAHPGSGKLLLASKPIALHPPATVSAPSADTVAAFATFAQFCDCGAGHAIGECPHR